MGEMNCELCEMRASIYCESDQARLCWDCDAKVHGANFLVEKHTRVLLCHACHEATPWTASGPRLGVSMSLCHACSSSSTSMSSDLASVILESERCPPQGNDSQGIDLEEEGSYSDDFDSDDEDEDENDEIGDDNSYETDEDSDEEDNQVVPWTPADILSSLLSGPSSSSSDDRDIIPPPGGWRVLRNLVESDSDLDSEEETSSFQTPAAVSSRPDPLNLTIRPEIFPPSRKRSRSASWAATE